MYGLKTTDEQGNEKHAQKATTCLTNSPAMDMVLNRRCDGTHCHAPLIGHDQGKKAMRTKLARVYPPELYRALARGVKLQKEWENKDLKLLAVVERDVGAGKRE